MAKWPKATPRKTDPIVFNNILEGFRAVTAKVQVSQFFKNTVKTFIYHDFRMSEEVQLSRFTSTFLEGLDVSAEDLDGLSICEAFDKVFKTDEFAPDFPGENGPVIIYAAMIRAVYQIEAFDVELIRKKPVGFRALLNGIKSLQKDLNQLIEDDDFDVMMRSTLIADGKPFWTEEAASQVWDKIENLLEEIGKMKSAEGSIKEETR